jgi:hypothetical protein
MPRSVRLSYCPIVGATWLDPFAAQVMMARWMGDAARRALGAGVAAAEVVPVEGN